MQKLSVLVVHNRYQQAGGEDTVVEAEVDLLQRAGHSVMRYERNNSEMASYTAGQKSSLLIRAAWNRQSYRAIRTLIREHPPDIAHFHNILPLISPAAYYACRAEGVPVVQTLHNYRLMCPAGTFFRDGQRCSGCGRRAMKGIWRGCYRNSRSQTATVAAMTGAHRFAKTWTDAIDAYVSPSRFCRDQHVRGGLPQKQIFCRPNFLAADPGVGSARETYALYVGRLSAEKGVLEMLEAWRQLPDVPLRVVGDGPLRQEAIRLIASASINAQLLGQMSREHTLAQVRAARFLMFPSRWHEPFGMTLLEAAACGVAAIAARVGAVPELVHHHTSGLLFDPDNIEDMVASVSWASQHPRRMEEMGAEARRAYLSNFTVEKSYSRLMAIYHSVLKN